MVQFSAFICGHQEERSIWYELSGGLYRLRWTTHGQLRDSILWMIKFSSHLLTVAPHILCIPGRTSGWSLSFSHYVLLVYSARCQKPQGDSRIFFLPTEQAWPGRSELQFGYPIYIKKNYVTGNMGENFRYERWPPLCLWGTQFGLLPDSVSPGLQLLLLK